MCLIFFFFFFWMLSKKIFGGILRCFSLNFLSSGVINKCFLLVYLCMVCVGVQQNDKLMRSFQLLCFERLGHHSSVSSLFFCIERKKRKRIENLVRKIVFEVFLWKKMKAPAKHRKNSQKGGSLLMQRAV